MDSVLLLVGGFGAGGRMSEASNNRRRARALRFVASIADPSRCPRLDDDPYLREDIDLYLNERAQQLDAVAALYERSDAS